MDAKNVRAIMTASQFWIGAGSEPSGMAAGEVMTRVSLMTDHMPTSSPHAGSASVPDPYYGGPAGFETVLDLLEDACSGLLTSIQEQRRG